MLNQTHILTLVKKLMMKILNLKLAISLEHQHITSTYVPNYSEEVFVITKIKNIVPWTLRTLRTLKAK